LALASARGSLTQPPSRHSHNDPQATDGGPPGRWLPPQPGHSVYVGLGVHVGVDVGVPVRVPVGVAVWTLVRVAVGTEVSSGGGGFRVLVTVTVGVSVRVGVTVAVGVLLGSLPANGKYSRCSTAVMPSAVNTREITKADKRAF